MDRLIIYIDEAGRGPLAGPVYVGLVALEKRVTLKSYKDSKMCSPKLREELYHKATTHKHIHRMTSSSCHTYIDVQGISMAIHTAICTGLEKLLQKITNKKRASLKTLIAHIGHQNIKLVMDGKYDFKLRNTLNIEVQTIVDGDAKVPQIGMASILAKVERDREMLALHTIYPQYGFDKHKGYGTKTHREKIIEHGPCKIHRTSFLKKLYHSDNHQQLFS